MRTSLARGTRTSMRYIRATKIVTDYIDVKTRADIYEEEWHYSDVYIDNAKLHLRTEEDVIVLDPITKKLQMLKGADIEHRSEDNIDRAVQYANAAGWALYTKDSTGAWKERISVSGGVDIAEVKIKNSVQKIVPPSGGDAIVVRDANDNEDRVKITEDGNLILKTPAGVGVKYLCDDGEVRRLASPRGGYPDQLLFTDWVMVHFNNIYMYGYIDAVKTLIFRSTGVIRTFDSADAVLSIKSHDGSAFRTNLKFTGGQAEVYSWDGSAEQLVAKTNSGYLEIARGKLTGDLIPDSDTTRSLGASGLQFNSIYVKTVRTSSGNLDLNPATNIISTRHVRPAVDKTFNLGYADYRWASIYFGSSLVGKSDTATDTETLKSSPPVELIASVWDSANAVAKNQKFKMYHKPRDINRGWLDIKFVDTDGIEHDVMYIQYTTLETYVYGIRIFPLYSTQCVLCSNIQGETCDRLVIRADGKLEWGDGANPRDTFLYRAGAGILQTDGTFRASKVLSNLGGRPRSVLTENGDVAIICNVADSTNTLRNSPYLRFYAAYWDGSASVDRQALIFHRMIDTTPKSEVAIQIAGNDYMAIGDEGIKCSQHVKPTADATYDLGTSSLRWNNLYCVTANVGDIKLSNGWKLTEYGNKLLFINPDGIPVLCLCQDGTLIKVECRKPN